MRQEERQAIRRRFPGLLAGSVSALGLLAIGLQARGQEGPLARVDLSLGGEYRANEPGEDETRATTRLGFQLSSVTRSQSFALSGDGLFVYDETGFDFQQPGIAFDYARENRSTAFDMGLSYNERDVEGVVDVIDPVTLAVIDLVNDDGTLESVQIDAGLVTGRDARFGTNTRVSFTDRAYTGTSDPDLTDLQSWQIGTTLRFDISPLIDLNATASHRVTREEDAENTETRNLRFGLGANVLIDPLWTAEVGVSHSIRETETDDPLLGRVLEEDEGTGFSVAISRQFRNGTLGASLVRTATGVGPEDTLSLFGDRRLVNGSDLSWSLGLVALPGGDTAPIVSASYARPMPRGAFSVNFRQSSSVDSDDESVVSTSVNLTLGREINSVSSWSLNGALSSVDFVSDAGEDQARGEIGLAYNHALTRDWNLSTGVRHSVTYAGGELDNSASILSISLQRSFSFRP